MSGKPAAGAFGRGRNFGLDITRAAAIGLVLVSHGLFFFYNPGGPRLEEIHLILGFLGVELFFVLSGFLIGGIILREVLSNEGGRGLGRFWARRWMRTLPPYFLMVAVLLVLGRPLHWQNLVFLQTLSRRTMAFFPISWSLAIEEWFYLLVPFALVLVVRRRGLTPSRFFAASAAIILASVAARFAAARSGATWDYGIHIQPPLRMDSLMIGVVLAGLRRFKTPAYGYLAARGPLAAAVGLAGVLACGSGMFTLLREGVLDASVFARTLFFPIVSIFLALIIVYLESSPAVNGALASRRGAEAVRFLSLTSYAAYLLHFEVFRLIVSGMKGEFRPGVEAVLMLVWLAATLLLSWVVYRFFEKPVLRLRDRWTALAASPARS
jgi:peptidoglycan/LPS O-acetylase OafA/YrhL